MSVKSGSKTWARLARMSPGELLERGLQEIRKRVDLARYRHGLGFDLGRAGMGSDKGRFFFDPAEVPRIITYVRGHLEDDIECVVARAERVCRHRFDVLGYRDLDYGRDIDWHRDMVHGKSAPRKPWFKIPYLDFDEVGDVKVTWELNRHQHLVVLAKAYRITEEDRFATELLRQWYSWKAENPYPIGVNWASSLEVAFRSLSWLWVDSLLAGTPAVPPQFRRDLLDMLALSGRHLERYLSTYFSPNTHLIGEGAALFFIGTLCPELKPAGKWQRRGWEIVVGEALRQVLPDGMHFEQSTYYHVYALDFFLHARILAVRNNIAVPAAFDEKLQSMLAALCTLSSAGPPPRFGDDDGGRLFDPARNRREHMLDPLATGAVLFHRGDFKSVVGGVREETVWLTGIQGTEEFERIPSTPRPPQSAAMSDSGIYVLADHHFGRQQFIVDTGPQGAGTAGHGHADGLSLQMNFNGRVLLADPGTFCYVGEEAERDRLRGTGAHNTLRVDGLDQAQPRGPFGWMALPQARSEQWICGQRFDLFAASHDGYCRLQNPVLHRRQVFYLQSRFCLVRDLALGQGVHTLDIAWHLGEDLNAAQGTLPIFWAADKTVGLGLLPSGSSEWRQEIRQEMWSPSYGRKQLHPVLRFSSEATLPVEFATLLVPLEQANPDVGIFSRTKDDTVVSYRYQLPHEEHFVFFSRPGLAWVSGSWASDAELLYCVRNNEGRLLGLILCNGSYAEVDGLRIVTCKERVTRCEVFGNAAAGMSSSDKQLVMLNQWPVDWGAASNPALSTVTAGLSRVGL